MNNKNTSFNNTRKITFCDRCEFKKYPTDKRHTNVIQLWTTTTTTAAAATTTTTTFRVLLLLTAARNAFTANIKGKLWGGRGDKKTKEKQNAYTTPQNTIARNNNVEISPKVWPLKKPKIKYWVIRISKLDTSESVLQLPGKFWNVVQEKDRGAQMDQSWEMTECYTEGWSGHVLQMNCLLKHITEGKTKRNYGVTMRKT